MTTTLTNDDYRMAAGRLFAKVGIEIGDEADVAANKDGDAWVQAWVHVTQASAQKAAEQRELIDAEEALNERKLAIMRPSVLNEEQAV